MATTNVPITTATRAGVQILTAAATAAASGDGNSFTNDGNQIIILENAGAATDVVATVVTQSTVDGLAVSDKTIALAANDRQVAGPWPPEIYNAKSGTDVGKVVVTWAGTLTNATIRVVGR